MLPPPKGIARPHQPPPSRLDVELAQAAVDALGDADGAQRRHEVDRRLDRAEAQPQAEQHDPLGPGHDADLAGRAERLGARPARLKAAVAAIKADAGGGA